MDQAPQVKEVALVLPLPPSVNHQYATVHGRRVLSRDGRAYKRLVAEEVEDWFEQRRLPLAAVASLQRHYLALSIAFYFVTPLRRDLDGGLKIAQDALCEALGVNDNLVVEIHLSKRVDRSRPRIEITLTVVPPEEVHLHQDGKQAVVSRLRLPPARKRRRGLRKPRSLDELATRYNWQ